MRGLATGNREGKPEEREQQIYTPWEIISVCLATWGRIELDPCSGPDSQVPAIVRYDEHVDGLTSPWVNGTYWNPPYADLAAWLNKSDRENLIGMNALCDPDHAGPDGSYEQIGLFPVRPNRVWWCEYMSTIPTVVAWLRPIKFVGFKSGFPAPLVLIYTGSNTEAFREAVKPLSTFVGGRLN